MSALLATLAMMHDVTDACAERREDILSKWIESANYPRKRKKRVRKELAVDWAIFSYDPFDFMNFQAP